MTPRDQFELQYAGELRDALIALEGNGAFELIGHGALPVKVETDPALYAVVRSSDSGAVYLLVRTSNPGRSRSPRWHEVSAADLPHFGLARPHAA